MEAVRRTAKIKKDGELIVTGLPFRAGQTVDLILLAEPERKAKPARPRMRKKMTFRDLLNSEAVGMWKDRTDIGDSAEFARKLREQAQSRRAI
ncbi:MAG: hypothetical protein RMN52_02830 [Anaerolineae bacterium]|nr:hypothetical protein [Candidatus Roseilinea sp.]MDW8448913.1 hypothetical protein [Anaerolineae bacterium]